MTTGPSVYFLSDYGTQDEFVGVVHAVITAGAPGSVVVDLTHEIEPFDVRAGSRALRRAVPHLPPGIVLAVIDPGVGTDRRGVCLHVTALEDGSPMVFVGPDNGLLIAAAEWLGGGSIDQAVSLHREPTPQWRGDTFAGRDLFAGAVARLCLGAEPATLGEVIETATLVRLFADVVEEGRDQDGGPCLRCEVTWVDRFGNVQLALTVADAEDLALPSTGLFQLRAIARDDSGVSPPGALSTDDTAIRRVDTFADLAAGELGLLIDANGHLALVAGEASAARQLGLSAGQLVVLAW
jgi:S-adenosylmethionine hydrolase